MKLRLPLLLALALAACAEDPPATLEERLAQQPGFWFAAREMPELEQRQHELSALGYSDGYEPAAGATGVVFHDPEQSQPGLNLYSSGHGPEAFLMDLDGKRLHRWSIPYEDLLGAPPMEHQSQIGWRRVRMLPGGSLLAIHGGLALIKLDRDSNLQWVFPGRAHHDLKVLEDGRILTLTRELKLISQLNPKLPSVDDAISVLSPEGKLLKRVSLVTALRNSRWFAAAAKLGRNPDKVQRLDAQGLSALDILHANSIHVLDGKHVTKHPAFAAGNVLVCLRELNAMVVVDLEQSRVVWYREGAWLAPHDPTLTAEGNLLVFDNMGHGGYSQVLELDPTDGTEIWAYRGDPAESFFSVFCGTASRLPGGNTLVTESCAGNAVEITPTGKVAWAFRSPHRAGEKDDLVAVLFEVERIAPERLTWLKR
ncbi:MAG: hypothetical protein ACI8QC_001659 [Planctomycetota bacterium]|jgi:hypothetical protein